MTIFVTKLKIVVSYNILTITKSDGVKHLGGIDTNLSAEILDINNWISTR